MIIKDPPLPLEAYFSKVWATRGGSHSNWPVRGTSRDPAALEVDIRPPRQQQARSEGNVRGTVLYCPVQYCCAATSEVYLGPTPGRPMSNLEGELTRTPQMGYSTVTVQQGKRGSEDKGGWGYLQQSSLARCCCSCSCCRYAAGEQSPLTCRRQTRRPFLPIAASSWWCFAGGRGERCPVPPLNRIGAFFELGTGQ